MADPTSEAVPEADAPDRRGAPRSLTRVLVVLGLVVFAWTSVGAFARATYGTRTAADEPQYLLSAISLAQDRDLDISDELREGAFVPFHEQVLPEQTKRLPDGRRVSPHDPLLPVVLAVPVAVGGWLGAKLALAAVAGVLAAAMVWVAVRRFAVGTGVAVAVVGAFAAVSPLVAYGTQVYPELPAALAVTVAIGAVTASPTPRRVAVFAVALCALPWLALKYAPVVAALALVAAWVWGWRRRSIGASVAVGVVLVVNLALFAVMHKAVYTGWTAYASGDEFVGGELTVVGVQPDYASRTVRLVELLVDRQFGLAAWAPLFLLAVPALAALARRRPPGSLALGLPLLAGWLNATFVALTMHGWWWPGRQVVVVVPGAVLAVAWFAERLRAPAVRAGATDAARRRWQRWWVTGAVATGAGVLAWAWLLVEVLRRQRALIIDFFDSANPLLRVWQLVLPDGQRHQPIDVVLVFVWIAVLAGLAWLGWRTAGAMAGDGSTSDPNPDDAHPAVDLAR